MTVGKNKHADVEEPENSVAARLQHAEELRLAGKYNTALEVCKECLKSDPACVDAHFLAIQLIREDSAPDMTPEKFSDPFNGDELQKAYAVRIQALQAEGKPAEALPLAHVLCLLAPSNGQCWLVTGILCLSLGKYDDAIGAFETYLNRAPDDLFFRTQIIHALLISGFDLYSKKLKSRIGLFLKEPGTVNLAFLSRLWLTLLTKDPSFASFLQGGGCVDYVAFRAWLGRQQFDTNLTDDYFLDGVRNCVIADVRVERLLVYLRHQLLDYITANDSPPLWALPLALAIAEQCFINEYIYEETQEESQKIEAVLAVLKKPGQMALLAIAVVACYRPLYSLKVKHFPADESLQGLFRQQITEPAEEHTLKKKIKAFSKISDDTSQRVRAQYEGNPYPRWISFGRLPDQTDDMVLDNADRIKPLKILVAGCATGHFPMRVCINYPYSSVTGIDLSLASLAYGLRKAREMGIDNLEFLHGDILDVAKVGKDFDIIFSIGVLHHMRDPEQGWRRLVDVLKPGGLMKIGLYPALERKHITEGRRFIAEHAIPNTPAGIPQMRRIIMDRPEDDPIRKVMPFNDFYSTSMMRDLFFHVQEQTFTIPRIKKDLAEFGLDFLGFSLLSGVQQAQFRTMFPDDPRMTTLDHWDVFEQKHPDTFTGLYHFWCQKRQTASRA